HLGVYFIASLDTVFAVDFSAILSVRMKNTIKERSTDAVFLLKLRRFCAHLIFMNHLGLPGFPLYFPLPGLFFVKVLQTISDSRNTDLILFSQLFLGHTVLGILQHLFISCPDFVMS
ncbi:hypothetical protein L3K78_01320, partial [Oscillospiraceae bacterium SCCA1]|nr:hypothetical protein [Oscillospiraceae bacterium SCCA1]